MESNIGKYLEALKNIISHEDDFKKSISLIIKKETNLEIEEKKISFKNQKIYISENSYIKTEIALKKEKILEKIRESFPKKKFLDIL